MSSFLQVVGGVLIAVVLGLTLNKQGKDIALLLGTAVCCMVLLVAVTYLEPVLEFIDTLQTVGNLDSEIIRILLKAVGVGLVAEIAALICADSGNSAMGKAIHILACCVILWLAIPLMTQLLTLLQKILGEI